jgi:hypothetical protein
VAGRLAVADRRAAPGPSHRPAIRTMQVHLAAAGGGCWWLE